MASTSDHSEPDWFPGFELLDLPVEGGSIRLRKGGAGPALLLLHGYPQTHLMWHKIAPALAKDFTVVCSDLRGYGDSLKPPGGDKHQAYSKRAMAADQVEVMRLLGFEKFMAAGHDRGGRVLHRLLLDHPDSVTKAAVLDIAPTLAMFEATDQAFAQAYFHWFFLAQRGELPERLIAADPDFMLEWKLGHWGRDETAFPALVVEEYKRCFRDPATIHATCEDYRAAAGIDLLHDREDFGSKLIECPLLALWGRKGVIERCFDALAIWRDYARDVSGQSIDCGHFLAEEKPEETLAALQEFFLP